MGAMQLREVGKSVAYPGKMQWLQRSVRSSDVRGGEWIRPRDPSGRRAAASKTNPAMDERATHLELTLRRGIQLFN